RLPLSRAAVARVLVSLAPDLIEAGDPYRVAWGALDAASQLGIPSVAYCHSNLEALARLAGGRTFGPAAAQAARRYMRHLYGRFDLVLAPSVAMARHLTDTGVARVAYQPLGVDTAAFHPRRASQVWRHSMGFDDATRVLVFAGRFAAEKHLDVLTAAVERLGDPYVLVAVGAGPRPPRGARVRVLPFVQGAAGLAEVLASADVFVHAGDQETFGLSVLEALACGTPAVVRGTEGLAELVDERTGIAVADGSAAAFAEAIAAVFERGPATYAEAARERGEAGDWVRVLPALAARYRRLVDTSEGITVGDDRTATGKPARPPQQVAEGSSP
ncbi:MAG: glycosyltransferase, partial [Caldimonas sp.]